ncbi:MAG TPA: heme exporter protein CcmB [Vicinamibacterales bacterium]
MFLRTALLVLRKDVAVEVKTFEILQTTLFFAVSVVLVFSFAFVKEGQAPPDAAAGILWIAIAFAGTLALGRTFERERYGETLRALLLAPAPRPALYVGKLLGMVTLLALAEAVLVPLIAFLFSSPLFARPVLLVALLASGTVGFASVGTLFGAMLIRSRTRDVLLPILLYPITVPVIICGVRGTAALIASPPDEALATMWLSILTAMDVVFLVLALWTFEPLMTE